MRGGRWRLGRLLVSFIALLVALLVVVVVVVLVAVLALVEGVKAVPPAEDRMHAI